MLQSRTMSQTAIDAVLSSQLSRSISELIRRPGAVSVVNIKRLAELYGFESFTETLPGAIERLTIAGSILLIDMDFSNSAVVNVSLSLTTDQKTKLSIDKASDTAKLVYYLKGAFSFTNCSNEILLACLAPPVHPDGELRYDVVKLNDFSANLVHLADFNKHSIYDSKGSSNVDLFNYMSELSLLMSFFSTYQAKILLQNASDTCEVVDILSGYRRFGRVVVNLENRVGIFIKYWEDNRRIRYRSLHDSSDAGVAAGVKVFEKLSKTPSSSSYYIQLGIRGHSENGLFQPKAILEGAYYQETEKQAVGLPKISLDSTVVSNVNFLSSIVLGPRYLTCVGNPEARACVNLKFLPAAWVPVDLVGELFLTHASYEEADVPESGPGHEILGSFQRQQPASYCVRFDGYRTKCTLEYRVLSRLKRVSSINLHAGQNGSLDFLKATELLLENLRSLQLVWNLLRSFQVSEKPQEKKPSSSVNLKDFITSIQDENRPPSMSAIKRRLSLSEEVDEDKHYFMQVYLTTVPAASELRAKIQGGRLAGAVYVVQVDSNLPLFRRFRAQGVADEDVKQMKIYVYQGNVVNVDMAVAEKLYVSVLDDGMADDKYEGLKSQLARMISLLNVSEDLYQVIGYLLTEATDDGV